LDGCLTPFAWNIAVLLTYSASDFTQPAVRLFLDNAPRISPTNCFRSRPRSQDSADQRCSAADVKTAANCQSFDLLLPFDVRTFYGYNRPGVKSSEAVIENWWRQALMGGAKAHAIAPNIS
jgi:hypothetical protein